MLLYAKIEDHWHRYVADTYAQYLVVRIDFTCQEIECCKLVAYVLLRICEFFSILGAAVLVFCFKADLHIAHT